MLGRSRQAVRGCSSWPAKYDRALVEQTDVHSWINQQERTGEHFRLALPPPNVTGQLHLGHAFTVAIQDALCRWHAKRGRTVEWVPGFDHAGIATQLQVEKWLWATQRTARQDLTRQQFVAHCDQWRHTRTSEIRQQLERLGSSLDWSRCYYTMDEVVCACCASLCQCSMLLLLQQFQLAVATAFHRLHRDGHIFRDSCLLNWCPQLQTTISDQEVDKQQVTGRMYYVSYPLLQHADNERTQLEVATTRPETMLADVALAVHPSDERYSGLVGRRVQHPLLPDVQLSIIADARVEPDLGTGVLKITPAHDFTDYEIGRTHGLPLTITCLNEKAEIVNGFGKYSGLDRYEAREQIVNDLAERGLLGSVDEHEMQLPVCSRTGDVLEPRLKEQWFVRADAASDRLLSLVSSGQLRLQPAFFDKHWTHWIQGARHWCLSRQLWWGHRVPAWQTSDGRWLTGDSEQDVRHRHSIDGRLDQDADVLDTWFSSSLVPLVLAGWPQRPLESVPLSLMETGHDILGFWVHRMLLIALLLQDQLPFNRVLLHGLIVDGQGKKMSKSTGNVIDPLDVIDGISQQHMVDRVLAATALDPQQKEASVEHIKSAFPEGIPATGADALRFGLLRHDLLGTAISFDSAHVLNAYKFCNKIWQAVTYCRLVWDESPPQRSASDLNTSELAVEDRWVLSQLASAQRRVSLAVADNQLHVATQLIYDFWLLSLCDVYLETTKQALWSENAERLSQLSNVLSTVVTVFVHELYPFMPHLAQFIFNRLAASDTRSQQQQSVALHSSPDMAVHEHPALAERMALALHVADRVRSFRVELQLPKHTPIEVVIECGPAAEYLSEYRRVLHSLTQCNFSVGGRVSPGAVPLLVNDTVTLWVGLQDADRQAIVGRVNQQIESRQQKLPQLKEALSDIQTKLEGAGNDKTALRLDRALQAKQYKMKTLETQIERLRKQLNLLQDTR